MAVWIFAILDKSELFNMIKKETKIWLGLTLACIFLIVIVTIILWETNHRPRPALIIVSLLAVFIIGGVLIWMSTLEKKRASSSVMTEAKSFAESWWFKETGENIKMDEGRGRTLINPETGEKIFGFLLTKISGSKTGSYVVILVCSNPLDILDWYDDPPAILIKNPLAFEERKIRHASWLKYEMEFGRRPMAGTVPIRFEAEKPDFKNEGEQETEPSKGEG